MIRDPSDGSVREPLSEEALKLLKQEAAKPPGPALDHEPTRRFMAGEVPSGLPTASTRPAMQAKLEKSRAWLKDYHERKGLK